MFGGFFNRPLRWCIWCNLDGVFLIKFSTFSILLFYLYKGNFYALILYNFVFLLSLLFALFIFLNRYRCWVIYIYIYIWYIYVKKVCIIYIYILNIIYIYIKRRGWNRAMVRNFFEKENKMLKTLSHMVDQQRNFLDF